MLELSKPIKNIYTSTFQQCIPSTSTTSSTLHFTVKHNARISHQARPRCSKLMVIGTGLSRQ
ncbi:MAG: hypothetical protein ACK51L_00585 [bacterium]